MAILGQQQNIRIGTENQSANSDSLFIAFNKIQTNFNTIFSNGSSYNTFNSGYGIGITTVPSTGTVNIVNTGVTKLTAGSGIALSGENGNITIAVNGDSDGHIIAGVTSIEIDSSTLTVSGGPIVSTGTLIVDLPVIDGIAGTYTTPSITIDDYGRITAVDNTVVGTVNEVNITADEGITVSGGPDDPFTGVVNYSIKNSGVTRLNAGTGISLTGSTGAVTISSLVGGGTVTSVSIASESLDITGSPITREGVIGLEIKDDVDIVNLTATGNIHGGNITIDQDGTIPNLFVHNISTSEGIEGSINLIGNVNISGNANIAGHAIVANVTVLDSWTLGDGLHDVDFVTFGNVTVHKDVEVGNTSTLQTSGNLHVFNNMTVEGNASVIWDATFEANVSVSGNVDIAGITTINGNLTANGSNVYFPGYVTVGWISAGGDSSIGGNLGVTGNLILNGGNIVTDAGDIITTGNLTLGSTSTFIGHSMTLDGTGIVGAGLYVTGGDFAVSDKFAVVGTTGDTLVSGNLTVLGDSDYTSGNMYAHTFSGNVIINNGLSLPYLPLVTNPTQGMIAVNYATNQLCVYYTDAWGTPAWRCTSLSPAI